MSGQQLNESSGGEDQSSKDGDGLGATDTKRDSSARSRSTLVAAPTDIICGRGIHIANHRGNLDLHLMVNNYREAYLASRRQQKTKIIKHVLKEVKHSGARFIKKVSDGKNADSWEEVDDATAYKKVSHALRLRTTNESNGGSISASDASHPQGSSSGMLSDKAPLPDILNDPEIRKRASLPDFLSDPQVPRRTSLSDFRNDPARRTSLPDFRNDPLSAVRHDPLSAVRHDPLSAVRHDPLSAVRHDPLSAARHDPLSAVRHDPYSSLRNDPLSSLRHDPLSAVGGHDPLAALRNDPLRNDPISAAQLQTPVASAASHAAAGARDQPINEIYRQVYWNTLRALQQQQQSGKPADSSR
eukprot:CAMPEP_0113629518 /NCGR_PEP_ID=MMETSP0017_2-20120614/15324_1 /TAXON_ID=2856 /ORGANISM="Cylindrotheca closterium" /LENGTH=356 /DNA_ID=CAMNT_0000539921 /DNA_START=19 /DNA_END=1089 /DNA_ORIENTATION=+ /assembly_acc=CAM_ASM_000147